MAEIIQFPHLTIADEMRRLLAKYPTGFKDHNSRAEMRRLLDTNEACFQADKICDPKARKKAYQQALAISGLSLVID